jgi:hypothetical protein
MRDVVDMLLLFLQQLVVGYPFDMGQGHSFELAFRCPLGYDLYRLVSLLSNCVQYFTPLASMRLPLMIITASTPSNEWLPQI